MKPDTVLRLGLAPLLILAFWTTSHSQVASADFQGRILNENSEPLPNVNITLRNQNTGISRGTSTSATGRFRFSALTPGKYEAVVQHIGFAVEINRDIVLAVGQVVSLDFHLTPVVLAAADTLVVVANTPLVATTESKMSVVVTEAEIRSLPLNSRNGVELALLSPGVNAARPSGPTTGVARVNFGGSNNRSTRVFVDGIDFGNDIIGGLMLTGTGVSQNAFEQFEVITNQFKAEYGLTDGGIINLITKSGTNTFHGSVFSFFRDDALNAANHFETDKPPFERQQFGFTYGGPLVLDRTHFFLAFERNRENNFAIVNTNGVFPEEEGTFKQPDRNSNFLLKLNHQLSSDHRLMAKYALQESTGEGNFGGSVARDGAVASTGTLHHVLVAHQWIVSEALLTELKFGFVGSDFSAEAVGTTAGLVFPSIIKGRSFLGRQSLDEERLELRADISYLTTGATGEHQWKFGFDIIRLKTQQVFGTLDRGRFIFLTDTSTVPVLVFAADGDPNLPGIRNHKVGLYLQNDWSPAAGLTFNLGVRYDVETNASNQNHSLSLDDPALPFLVKSNRSIDKNNLAPRLGFAWDPFKSGQTVIHGGYGIFYGRVIADFPNAEIKTDQYRIYRVPSPGTTNKDEIDFSALPIPVDWLLPEDVPIPGTHKFSIGLSRQMGPDFAVDIGYVGERGFDQIFAREEVNPLDPATFTRPLPQYGEVLVSRTDGRSYYDALQIVLRKRFSNNYQFRASYTLSETENHFDDPIFAGRAFERGPAAWDERHRFVFSGQIILPFDLQLSGLAVVASARPYSIFTGIDANRNTDQRDDRPPGVGRNSERPDGFSNIDLRLTKTVAIDNYNLELIAEVFNLFNTTNFQATSYVGNQQSANFGQPTIALPPRQVQLGFRASF